MRFRVLGAATALAMTTGASAWADDATPGSSIRPPADAEGSGSASHETDVPADKRKTDLSPALPGDSLESVDDWSDTPTAGADAADDVASSPASNEDTDASAEEPAKMTQADANAEAVGRYIESLKQE